MPKPKFKLDDIVQGTHESEVPSAKDPAKKVKVKFTMIGKVKAYVYSTGDKKWEYFLEANPIGVTESQLKYYDEATGKAKN